MIAAAQIASVPIGDPVLSQGIGASRQKWLAPVIGGLRRASQVVRQLGPYAAIELILPGGSLLAILLWLYRRSRLARGAGGTGVGSTGLVSIGPGRRPGRTLWIYVANTLASGNTSMNNDVRGQGASCDGEFSRESAPA
jgi:hypothetical protein